MAGTLKTEGTLVSAGAKVSVGAELSAPAPYLLQTVHLVYIELLFDASAVRAALPIELEPSEASEGFALFYASAGSELAPPSTAFYLGIFLKDRDAPDGSPGIFVAQGYYSNEANLAASRTYSSRFDVGAAQIEIDGDMITGGGGPKGEAAVEFTLRRRKDQPPLMMGTHQYYGERPGGLTTYSLAFAARLFGCEVVAFRISPNAPPILKLLTPQKVIRASYVSGAPLYFSKPRPVASFEHISTPDAAHLAIVDVLSHLGRGAIVVHEDGLVLVCNEQAREALGPLLRSSRLEPTDAEDRKKLKQLIEDAARARGEGIMQRMLLHRADADALVVQAGNYRGGWHGQPTALLLINDPHAIQIGDVAQELQLLGLTRAEARIAAAFGRGLSARATATALGLTENTVRSSLRVIYEKLNISSKTELANVLAQFSV